ncbi:MAG: FAD-binding protein, partial [Pirellulaceae bacterium]|nr:FAD-binding protein [Pirellulaceae bacterium]
MMLERQVSNFGNNVCFTPAVYAEPRDEAELLDLLRTHKDLKVRVIASGHAWSDAIKTDGLLINVKHFNDVRVSPQDDTVHVGAGCQIKGLAEVLSKQGKSLPTSGLIDEQTVAGATATGTHGSGKNSLSQYIRSVRVAHFDQETGAPKVSTIRGPSVDLSAARCSFGLLGVIVEVEMEIRPAYNVLEFSARYQTLEQVLALESEYPLQQFYLMPWSWHWFGQHRTETTQPRSKLAALYRIYWHLGIDWALHLIIFVLVRIMRVKGLIRSFFKSVLPLVVVKNWRVVDNSQKMLTMDHDIFRHIEIEVFVRRADLKKALEHVKQIIQVFGGQAVSSDLQQKIPESSHGIYQHHYPIC